MICPLCQKEMIIQSVTIQCCNKADCRLWKLWSYEDGNYWMKHSSLASGHNLQFFCPEDDLERRMRLNAFW
jgi:hypothetical protein